MSQTYTIADLIKQGYVLQKDGSWAKPTKGKKVATIEQKAPKKHKYGAISKDVDGQHYDSTREYEFSLLLKQANIDFRMKEVYVLQEKFNYMGECVREIRIIPDYGIYHKNGLIAIVDIKGMILSDFKMKVKLLKHLLSTKEKEIPIFMPTNKKEMNETIIELLKLIK